MPRGTEITREQLDVLRNKFDLLQGDRKAYFETYEATKKTNDDLIKDLRERSKEARRQLALLQKEGRSAGADGSGTVSRAEMKLKQHRNAYDSLRARTIAKQGELSKLRDHYRDLELEAKKLSSDDSPMTRKIRQLENRLDKAMIKYNEAQSIKKTYEQIVRRLNEERVGFDNQLAALERTLAAKEHDHEELLLLSGDAQHAKEVAMSELERVRTVARQEKERRVKELREKKAAVRARSEMYAMTQERERMRTDMTTSPEETEAQLKRDLEETQAQAEALAEESAATRHKMEMYEDAFRKIKEATGVSDVNEVIQKIVSQDQQQASLKQLTKTNATKIEGLNEELTALKEHVDEVKYSGPGAKTGARKMVDSYEEKLTASTQRLERSKDKYERLAKILINVKAGIDHLTEKLHGSAESTVLPPMQSVAEADDATIVDVLAKCEATLVEVVDRVETGDDDAEDEGEEVLAVSFGRPETAPGGVSGAAMASLGISEADITNTRIYNTRINLLDDGTHGDSGDDDDGYGMDDDTLETRESVKRASKQAVNQSRRGGKKRGSRR